MFVSIGGIATYDDTLGSLVTVDGSRSQSTNLEQNFGED